MRALDFCERTFPGASLVLDLGVHAPAFADLNADRVAAARPAAIAVRARISADFHAGGSGQLSGELVADGAAAPPGDGGGGWQVC